MRYKKLGNTGLFVSELCLGTMTFGGQEDMWGKIGQLQQAQAEELVGRALDAGINFIDTADVYSGGRSEEITGQALKNLKVPRENVVVATKVFGETGTAGVNSRGSSRFHIIQSVKASLKRLQLDHIDLYQLHGFDPATPMEETLYALDTLVQHGHVRYIGVSNWAAWQIAKALGISERLGLARFASLQAYYTIAGRDLERELVPMMQSENVGLMVWSPLAGGLLSGKYGRDGKAEAGGRRVEFDFPPVNKDRAFDCVDVMRAIADSKGVSVAQIALAWLLHQQAVTSVIIGAKRPEQLDDNLAATTVQLSDEELKQLDAVSALPGEYPGWMLERQGEYCRNQLNQQ
ncbi:aldo/keto reductase [Kosakonia cowanii]|uniref:aldo/keto reductase n=1 Tax=Kosakonia cowanii TaxID=208223 RepID=UPI00111CE189|nr:aldo/keto reductase [Kosakonia cowanii]MDP9768402.1 aryl-alcohol dehydrogenase-like predicted oxidoreductase [Atlantibacter hermannii]TPD69619.1 aldo/keto reductase [Kosakonia cowanii]TPD92655.1 aldo/keto reductase [Kosakonia cowanii]TPE08675.1 aldo/keto reductase [Kosakonia cowanii]